MLLKSIKAKDYDNSIIALNAVATSFDSENKLIMKEEIGKLIGTSSHVNTDG